MVLEELAGYTEDLYKQGMKWEVYRGWCSGVHLTGHKSTG